MLLLTLLLSILEVGNPNLRQRAGQCVENCPQTEEKLERLKVFSESASARHKCKSQVQMTSASRKCKSQVQVTGASHKCKSQV